MTRQENKKRRKKERKKEKRMSVEENMPEKYYEINLKEKNTIK